MDIKEKGIVLRTIRFKDNQYISDIYTENHGRKSFLIRVPKSGKGKTNINIFQHFFQVEFEGIYKPNRDIQTIRETQLLHTYHDLPYNVIKTTIAMFVSELLIKCLYDQEENPELFMFLIKSGLILDNSPVTGNFPIVFMKELAQFLGFKPENNFSEERHIFDMERGYYTLKPPDHSHYLVGENAKNMHKLLSHDLINHSEMKSTKAEREILMEFMINYYRYHIENFGDMKSLAVLKEVFG